MDLYLNNRPEPRPRPNRANFDDSGEFLEAENVYHFGESEEVQELVNVDSDEIRRSPHKAPVTAVVIRLGSKAVLP